jgi:hypothetical protein
VRDKIYFHDSATFQVSWQKDNSDLCFPHWFLWLQRFAWSTLNQQLPENNPLFPYVSQSIPKEGFGGNTLKLLYLCLSFLIPTNPASRTSKPQVPRSIRGRRATF